MVEVLWWGGDVRFSSDGVVVVGGVVSEMGGLVTSSGGGGEVGSGSNGVRREITAWSMGFFLST